MRNGDHIRAKIAARLLQKTIPRIPPGLFQRLPAAVREGWHICMAAVKRHAVKLTQAAHKFFVRIRRGAADAVVEMRRIQAKPHCRRKRPKGVQKRDRVRPAAHAGHDA